MGRRRRVLGPPPGGHISLHGGVTPYGTLDGVVRTLTTGEEFSFDWEGNHALSRVTVAIRPMPQGGWSNAIFTEVVVSQDLGSTVESEDEQWARQTSWGLWLKALRAWSERGEVVPGPAVSESDATVVERIRIRRPAALIWPYLVDPVYRDRWFHEPLGPEVSRVEGVEVTYLWPEPGMASTVTWSLRALDDDHCEVTIRHPLPKPGGFAYHVGWSDYLAALSYEGGRPRIVQSVSIAASPAKIWPYLSTREGMEAWWPSLTAFRAGLGGYVEMQEHGTVESGEIVIWEPERRMGFLWREADNAAMAQAPLRVVMELEAMGDGNTRVTVTQDGFENLPPLLFERPPDFIPHDNFWEWELMAGVWIQVVHHDESAPRTTPPIRLGVDDIERERRRIVDMLAVPMFPLFDPPEVPVRWGTFEDPWGNRIGLFQPLQDWTPRLVQISIFVQDLDAAVKFYAKVAGFAVSRALPPEAVELHHPGLSLLLHRADRVHLAEGLTETRISISLPTRDMAQTLARLRELGVDLLTPEPGLSPFGPWIAFRDPWGNVVEYIAWDT